MQGTVGANGATCIALGLVARREPDCSVRWCDKGKPSVTVSGDSMKPAKEIQAQQAPRGPVGVSPDHRGLARAKPELLGQAQIPQGPAGAGNARPIAPYGLTTSSAAGEVTFGSRVINVGNHFHH